MLREVGRDEKILRHCPGRQNSKPKTENNFIMVPESANGIHQNCPLATTDLKSPESIECIALICAW